MILDEAIRHCEEKTKELREQPLKEKMDIEDIAACEECAEDHEQLAKWLAQLKLITELVQEYADKETPEKKCDEDPECWGIEATTLLGKIADILKIDRCEVE